MNISFERIGYMSLPFCRQDEPFVQLIEERPDLQGYLQKTPTEKQIVVITCPNIEPTSFMGVSKITQITEKRFLLELELLGEKVGHNCADSEWKTRRDMLVIALPKVSQPTYEFQIHDFFMQAHDDVLPEQLLLGQEFVDQSHNANCAFNKHPWRWSTDISVTVSKLLFPISERIRTKADSVALLSDPSKYHEEVKKGMQEENIVLDLNDPQVSEYLSLAENDLRLCLLYPAILADKEIELLGPKLS